MNTILRRSMLGGAAIALTVVGAASAQAWTWASSSNPIVMTGGGGYGNLNFSGTTATLQSWLRDTKVGDGRVYAKVAITNSKGLFANLTSGQRSDGSPTYARMSDKSLSLSQLPGNYTYVVRTCRSATLQDPCSTASRSLN
ncbi:MAG: hypothetical protein ACRCYX_04285 [Dermatophilaceae bacterium]